MKRKPKGRRQPEPPKIKRHYTTLSPKETQEAVESVAELIVNYVKQKGVAAPKTPDPEPAEKPDPEQPRADVPAKKKRKGRR